MMLFFLSELNTDGSIAGDQLTLKYKLNNTQVENMIRKYIKDYVKCDLCKSMNTELTRDKHDRLEVLECQNCKSTKFVEILKKK